MVTRPPGEVDLRVRISTEISFVSAEGYCGDELILTSYDVAHNLPIPWKKSSSESDGVDGSEKSSAVDEAGVLISSNESSI